MKAMRSPGWSMRGYVLVLWIPAFLGGVVLVGDAGAQESPVSSLVYPGPDGRLIYEPYANCGDTRTLNLLPDWSSCGYMGGGIKIPAVPVKKTISPVFGDNQSNIQAAIDYVSQLPCDANGFRGAVLLKKGRYPVEGTLSITVGGVVLRGEGQSPNATVIVDTGQDQDTLIVVNGGSRADLTDTRTQITDTFVPVGAARFRVASTTGFSVGDRVIVHRQTNDKWIDDLKMRQYGWTASYYEDQWERVITAIAGNEISVDAPLVQAIDEQYGGGSIYKCTIGDRIRQVGIENLWLVSEFDSATDETHGWNGIGLSNVEDAWVRNVTSRYFGYSCVSVLKGARCVTVQDCACLDPKSEVSGGRRYSFNLDDCCFVLVQRCFTREGRHDFITGSRVPGPNVFVDCLGVDCKADSGNHHRYAEGTLFDNVKATDLAVENRQDSGSGHGWSGAQTMFWNCEARTICHAPSGAMNWAIGNVGFQKFGSWAPQEPWGFWESLGAHVRPRSLYYTQLQDRCGAEAVANVTTVAQRAGPIWNQLASWMGMDDSPAAVIKQIELVNGSFEVPVGSATRCWDGEDPGSLDVPGWTSDSNPANSGSRRDLKATDGDRVASVWQYDPPVWQLTSYAIQGNEILELKLDAWGGVTVGATLKMTLFYESDGARMPLAALDVALSSAPQQFSLFFDARKSPNMVGRTIGVEVVNTSDWPAYMDNVRLFRLGGYDAP